MEDGQYAAISVYLEHGLTQLYLRNPRNLYYEEAAKIIQAVKKASCITRNRFKMEQSVIDLLEREVKQTEFFLMKRKTSYPSHCIAIVYNSKASYYIIPTIILNSDAYI